VWLNISSDGEWTEELGDRMSMALEAGVGLVGPRLTNSRGLVTKPVLFRIRQYKTALSTAMKIDFSQLRYSENNYSRQQYSLDAVDLIRAMRILLVISPGRRPTQPDKHASDLLGYSSDTQLQIAHASVLAAASVPKSI
jgi:hypothetical protein